MRAFVTGGTGLIGRPLVDVLVADAWEVTVLTRNPSRAKDLEARGVHLVAGDVTRPCFDAAMTHSDVVFHVAGWYEIAVRDSRRMHQVNVTGTANVPMAVARFAARFSEAYARFVGRTPLQSPAALDPAAVDLVVDASKARALWRTESGKRWTGT